MMSAPAGHTSGDVIIYLWENDGFYDVRDPWSRNKYPVQVVSTSAVVDYNFYMKTRLTLHRPPHPKNWRIGDVIDYVQIFVRWAECFVYLYSLSCSNKPEKFNSSAGAEKLMYTVNHSCCPSKQWEDSWAKFFFNYGKKTVGNNFLYCCFKLYSFLVVFFQFSSINYQTFL